MEKSATLAFKHLNLRRNPFGEATFEERSALAVVELEEHLPRLALPGFALQILGAAGRGKSTILHALRRHFPEAVYLYVGEGERPAFPQGHPFLLDEAQRVPRLQRERLFRRHGVSFALASHEDLAEEVRAAGLAVETIRPAEQLDRRRLEAIVRRRIDWARRGPGPLPQVSARALEVLLARHGTDVRSMEGALYEAFQRLKELRDVEL